MSLLETVLSLIIAHTGQGHCVCPDIDLKWSFATQILTIPFVWQIFPYLKEVILCVKFHYINFVLVECPEAKSVFSVALRVFGFAFCNWVSDYCDLKFR